MEKLETLDKDVKVPVIKVFHGADTLEKQMTNLRCLSQGTPCQQTTHKEALVNFRTEQISNQQKGSSGSLQEQDKEGREENR